jgi:hypothetical protein
LLGGYIGIFTRNASSSAEDKVCLAKLRKLGMSRCPGGGGSFDLAKINKLSSISGVVKFPKFVPSIPITWACPRYALFLASLYVPKLIILPFRLKNNSSFIIHLNLA